MTKFCPHCQQERPYDPTKPKKSKASGFHQAHCWSCYLLIQRATVTRYYQAQKQMERICLQCHHRTERAHMYKKTQICYSCHWKDQKHAA